MAIKTIKKQNKNKKTNVKYTLIIVALISFSGVIINSLINHNTTIKSANIKATSATTAAEIRANGDSSKSETQPPSINITPIEQTTIFEKPDRNQRPLPKLELDFQNGDFAYQFTATLSLYEIKTPAINRIETFTRICTPGKQIVNMDNIIPKGLPAGNYKITISTRDNKGLSAQHDLYFNHYYSINYFRDGDAKLHDNSRMEIINGVLRMAPDSDGYISAETLPKFKLENGYSFIVTGTINIINGQPLFWLILANSYANTYGEGISVILWEDAGFQERYAKLILRRHCKDDIEADKSHISGNLTHAYLGDLPAKFHFGLIITVRGYETQIACHLSQSLQMLFKTPEVLTKTLNTYESEALNLIDKDICVVVRANKTGIQDLESLEIHKIPNTPPQQQLQIGSHLY